MVFLVSLSDGVFWLVLIAFALFLLDHYFFALLIVFFALLTKFSSTSQ
ncbi:MAG: hypothetical protein ACE5DI_01825 [Candidatus Micrarchaeia archaeon]